MHLCDRKRAYVISLTIITALNTTDNSQKQLKTGNPESPWACIWEGLFLDGLIIGGILRYCAFEFLCRSSFAVDGVDCAVNKDVEQSIKAFHAAKKPIG